MEPRSRRNAARDYLWPAGGGDAIAEDLGASSNHDRQRSRPRHRHRNRPSGGVGGRRADHRCPALPTVDKVYPAQNARLAQSIRENGALAISEYPPGMSIHREFFFRRNRIVAGMSLGVLVVEAGKGSGAAADGA